MVDVATLAAIATAGSAMATGLLALATFWLARMANKSLSEQRKQLRILTYQGSAMRSQLDPLLKLHKWSFKGNKLTLEIENMGAGRAYFVGVYSWFSPSSLIRSAEKDGKPLTDDEERALAEKGAKIVWVTPGSFDSKRKLFFQGMKDVVPSSAVSVLFNDRLGGEPLLDPQERRTLEVEPNFAIKPRKEPGFRSEQWVLQLIDFSQVREFLQANAAGHAVLGFRVVCRNSVDDIVYGESFGQLVMFVNEDSALEDVAKRNFTHSQVALGEREFPKMKYIGWEMYTEGKFIKSPQENPF
jgi:hypothetical protein